MFLDGHHFYSSNGTGSFEVDTKRLDFDAFILGTSAKHRVRVHVIQIGVITDLSPNKIEWQKDSQGRMISTPPRLNRLLLQQRSLRNIMDPFLWNYVLEKGLEEELDAEIESLCLHFCEVFVLWDGAFLLAWTVNPMELDVITYQRYVLAAVAGSKDLQCTVTPKVHMTLKRVK